MPLTVKRIIINAQVKNSWFSDVFRGYRNKALGRNVLQYYSQTPVFESLEDPINSLIHQDDTEQATVFQILLLKTLFSWLLNSLFWILFWKVLVYCRSFTAQKMKFSGEDFFKKCDQIRVSLSLLRIWPDLSRNP